MDGVADDEALDPRIQVELETLNKASENINKMELELDKERNLFRQILTDSTHQLNGISKKLGTCIDKARPYYEVRLKAREAQIKTQDAALRYERACSQLMAAKEMVSLAEEGFFNKGQQFDPAWQEMLNHATMKVNEAEKEKIESEYAHMDTAAGYNEIDREVKMYQKDLKRTINKSRPYFEMKAKFSQVMEEQKQKVSKLEKDVNELKRCYGCTLKNLEVISAEIHQQREEAKIRKEMGVRSSGVGAESPIPPPTSEHRRPNGSEHEGHRYESHRDTVQRIARRLESQRGIASDSDYPPVTVVSQKGVVMKKQLKRTNSYENAVDLGVTDDTKKGLGAIVGITDKKLENKSEIVEGSQQKAHGYSIGHSSQNHAKFDISQKSKDRATSQMVQQAPTPEISSQKNGKESSNHYTESNPKNTTSHQNIPKLATDTMENDVILPDSITTSENIHIKILPEHRTLVPPKASPEDLTPDTDEGHSLHETLITNSEIMTTLQEAKDFGMALLKPSLASSNTLNEMVSDSETASMASGNMLDDDQIQSVMYGFDEMEQFASQLSEKDLSNWKQMTLPAKLNFLEDYVKFKPLFRVESASSMGKTPTKSVDAVCGIRSNDSKVLEDSKGSDKDINSETTGERKINCSAVYETGVEVTESTYL